MRPVKTHHEGAEPRRYSPSPMLSTRPHRETELPLGIKDQIIFWLIAGALYLFSLIPDFLLYPIGIVGGFIGYQLDRRHHVIGMRNLAIAFPERSEAQRRRILRASYVNLGRGAAEYVRMAGFFHPPL